MHAFFGVMDVDVVCTHVSCIAVSSGFSRLVTDLKSFGICGEFCWRTQLTVGAADDIRDWWSNAVHGKARTYAWTMAHVFYGIFRLRNWLH